MAGFDDYPLGVEIEDRYLMQRAMSGDLVFVVTPATCNTGAGAKAAGSRTVTIELKTADGEVHNWFNKDLAANQITIADTHANVNATIPDAVRQFRHGKCTVVITLPEGTYVATQTDTLTMTQQTICGYTVAAKTSVNTIA